MIDPRVQETCIFSLNYAYIHAVCCLVQAGVMWLTGRTKHFKTCHAFGLFAFAIDYALNYMTLETRTITYPNIRIYQDVQESGDDAMGPISDFIFFVWFSYSAFGVLLWAFQVQEIVHAFLSHGMMQTKALLRRPVDIFSFMCVPLQFWVAPILSRIINVDNRELLLARSSNKNVYFIMLAVGVMLLRFCAKLPYPELFSILFSGFCCGLVHHAALFYLEMRGYSDVNSLLLTLVSEWPALIVGIATIQRLGWPTVCHFLPFLADDMSKKGSNVGVKSERGTNTFILVMWLSTVCLLMPHFASLDTDNLVDYMMVYIPGKRMQSLGTLILRTGTCTMPTYIPQLLTAPTNCWDKGAPEYMVVMTASAKAGALLSGTIVNELGRTCGLCVASGERSRAGIPGPVEDLPTYDGRILHAITNMRTWPDYVEKRGFDMRSLTHNETISNKQVVCATLIRDPISRLRSLYTYARSGGEHWFRTESCYKARLEDPTLTLQQSLDFFWNEFGKEYLVESHIYTMQNLKHGCTRIKMEAIKSDFNGAMGELFDAYGINQHAQRILLARLSKQDTSTMSATRLQKDSHFTANKFSKKLVDEILSRLLDMPEVKLLVEQQRIELGYTE